MSERDDHTLNQAIDAVRQDAIADREVSAAAVRVWARISQDGSAGAAARLRNCDDFRSLLPDYLGGTLPDSRRLLLEDHLHECTDCRRSLDAARGNVRAFPAPSRRAVGSLAPGWKLSVAAALLVGATAVTMSLVDPPGARAVVDTVDGGLYTVTAAGAAPVLSASELGEGRRVRTGRATRAVLRLHDGSRVEMAERSELAVHRGWFGTTVNLDKGNIIVQAAKQGWLRRLHVATGDSRVTVKGTIFAVSAGLKGSRVSVIEGAVQVAAGNRDALLKPGDQSTSTPELLRTSVAEEIAWSRDAARYYTLLADMKVLARRLDAIPGPGVRFESRLLNYVPADAAFVASLPNFGNTLAEANRVFQARLKESDVLREWWTAQGSKTAEFEQGIEAMKTLAGYLGDEVVVAIPRAHSQPVVLAEVRNSALPQFIATEMARRGAPAEAMRELDRRLVIADNVAILSPDDAMLRALQAAVRTRQSSGFAATPFGAQIANAYRHGAGWLFAADLAQVQAGHKPPEGAGLNTLRYLVIERKEAGGKTETSASLNFAADRAGIASWLAPPSKMGALEFISPDATAAIAVSLKNPAAMLDDALRLAGSRGTELTEAEAKLGIRFREDIAQALGGDVALAIDGGLIPTPAWKVVVEANDAARLEQAFEKLLGAARQQAPAGSGFAVEIVREGELRHVIARSDKGTFDLWYTFSNGYLVAAGRRESVLSAVQNRATGYWLARSPKFLAQLPRDGQPNLSAVLYENVGPALAPLLGGLSAVQGVSESQRQAMATLANSAEPALVYAYGEPDRIRVASTANLLGLALDSMMWSGAKKK